MPEEKICKTPGALYATNIRPWVVTTNVWMPEHCEFIVTEEQAQEIENKIHDALEEILAPYFNNNQPEALS